MPRAKTPNRIALTLRMHFEFLMLLIMDSPSWLLSLDESKNIQVKGTPAEREPTDGKGRRYPLRVLYRGLRIADSEGRGGASTF